MVIGAIQIGLSILEKAAHTHTQEKKKHGSILPYIIHSGFRWWCNGVRMFSWHTLNPLVPTKNGLNTNVTLNTKA